METYIARGIVLKETDVGESNKVLTAFTDADGKITLSARGAKKPSSKCFAGAQLFCFSEMNIFKGGTFNRLNNATPIESFYELRTDLEVLENAGKVASLTLKVIQENQPDPETLRLLLNTYYFMNGRRAHPELLKSIFMVRLLCVQGFYPEEDTILRYSHDKEEGIAENTFAAVKHICEAEDEKLFSFNVSDNVRKKLSEVSEKLVRQYIYE